MAIRKTESMSNMSQFVTWLQENLVPNFFQSVEVDSEDNTLIVCTGVGGQKLLGIKMHSTSAFYPDSCILYKSDGTATTVAQATSTNTVFRYAAVCNNGALIRFDRYANNTDSNNPCIILISKTNLDKTAVVVTATFSSSGYTAGVYMSDSLRIIAEGDAPTMYYLTFSLRRMQQAQFIQFATCPESGVVSFTPNAFYMQSCSFYTSVFDTVTVDGVDYMTNGYWAIKDE